MEVKTLAEWRRSRLFSQYSLAHKAGMHGETIRKIETGRTPTPRLESIGKLSRALGLDDPRQVQEFQTVIGPLTGGPS